MIQKAGRIVCWIVVLMLGACEPEGIRIRGELQGWNGQLEVWGELPGQDSVLLETGKTESGKIDLTVKVNPPARLRLCFGTKGTVTLIADQRKGTWIQGNIDSLEFCRIEGTEMQRQYRVIRELFREKYEKPLGEIEETIGRLEQKAEKSRSEERMWKENVEKRKRYRIYRVSYSQKMIEANPSNELSLFLLQDELQDSIKLQKTLFQGLDIKNKESNIYQVLSAKLK